MNLLCKISIADRRIGHGDMWKVLGVYKLCGFKVITGTFKYLSRKVAH